MNIRERILIQRSLKDGMKIKRQGLRRYDQRQRAIREELKSWDACPKMTARQEELEMRRRALQIRRISKEASPSHRDIGPFGSYIPGMIATLDQQMYHSFIFRYGRNPLTLKKLGE